jgi:hypothetical protein
MGHAPTSVLCPKCFVCGNQSILDVPHEGFDLWDAGAFVQDAFPTLTPGEREMLITGTHPECWDKMFAEEGDDYTPAQEYI